MHGDMCSFIPELSDNLCWLRCTSKLFPLILKWDHKITKSISFDTGRGAVGPTSPYQVYLPGCVSVHNMPIQGRGMSNQRAESEQGWCRREGIAGGECGVCVCWRADGCTEEGEWLRCREGGGGAWFPVPQIPSSCLRSRYTKPPLKVLERGGRMKHSHWWLTDLSPWTPPPHQPTTTSLPSSCTARQRPVCLHSPKPF